MASGSEKTDKYIINAFISLRARKDIEKITVKELCQLADINKATFYRHYKDIYDLSDHVEDAFIKDVISSFSDTDIFFQQDGFKQLTLAFTSRSELFNILFSGSRSDTAVRKIHTFLMEAIFEQHPEYKNDIARCAIITTFIFGIFHAYFIYRDHQPDEALKGLSKLNEMFLAL